VLLLSWKGQVQPSEIPNFLRCMQNGSIQNRRNAEMKESMPVHNLNHYPGYDAKYA
jgi:hypothetical protein